MSPSTASAVESAADVPIAGQDGRPGTGRRLAAQVARFFWLWPALLTLGLGVYHGARAGLWRDELATWSAVNRSTDQLFALLHKVDASTGAYYLFEHYWISLFGHSLMVLRLPSALAMAGAAVFVALTGQKLFGRRAGLVAGLLFATIPSVSRYAQEFRGYAIVVLAVAAATWLLLRALERPTLLRWLPYACCITFAGYFHMVSLVFLSSHAVIVAMRWWRGRQRALLVGFPVAALVGLLPVLPLVVVGRRQVGRQLSWLTSPSLEYVGDWFWRGLFGSSWVSYAFLVLAVLPLAWPKRRRPAVEIGLVAFLPIVLVWIISQGSTSYFLDRYLLFTLPAWAVLAGAALTVLRPRALAAVGLAAVVLLGIPEQRHLRQAYARENYDAKAAAAVIAEGYRPGDGFAPARAGDLVFLQIDTAIDYNLPSGVKPKDVFALRSPVQADELFSQPCPDPSACIGDTPRVWVVTLGAPWDPLGGLSPAELKALKPYTKVSVTGVPGMTVTLMERHR